jgi:tetratricopeptide (TPR) repeat protein
LPEILEMKMKRRGLNFALSLCAVACILPVMPVIAKKAAVPTSNRNWSVSDAFRAAAAPIEADIKVQSYDAALRKLASLEAVASGPDEKYVAAGLHYAIGVARNDARQIAVGSAGLISSGAAPSADLPRLNLVAGQSAFLQRDYRSARFYLAEAVRRNSSSPDVQLMLSESALQMKLFPEAVAAANEAIRLQQAAGLTVPDSWYERVETGLASANAPVEMAAWSVSYLRARPTPPNWEARLLNYWLVAGAKPKVLGVIPAVEAKGVLDLYRLIRASHSLSGEAGVMAYANAALQLKAPAEAKSVIEEAWATSVIARDNAASISAVAQAKKALGASKPATGDQMLEAGNDTGAITQYRAALKKPGANSASINTHLGIALARSGNKPDARAAFALVDGPSRPIAQFWQLWLELNP